MVIDSMLCQLVRHEDDGIQSLNMLVATMGEIEIVWFCPAEKVALKGLWGHWHQVVFYGFDDGVPF
ncbi:hypothetical protein [Citrobacter freundii]|uniref:hypothetical protein n=1 Tax=Citrobacter freundii TaxID=546 RepID=UPI0024E16F9F|nr:hypothetical protein [Citrobacter freundii]MEB1020382.1 hypothetical protein [Citrobacter freundii]WIJ22033.1 hypothetical protein QOK75_08140 [Citrobacter freundii]WOQ09682.1 hypothetical protein R2X30_06410 [Citrobacter freundii]